MKILVLSLTNLKLDPEISKVKRNIDQSVDNPHTSLMQRQNWINSPRNISGNLCLRDQWLLEIRAGQGLGAEHATLKTALWGMSL